MTESKCCCYEPKATHCPLHGQTLIVVKETYPPIPRYSFDDVNFGVRLDGNVIYTRMVIRPKSITRDEWYRFAGELARCLKHEEWTDQMIKLHFPVLSERSIKLITMGTALFCFGVAVIAWPHWTSPVDATLGGFLIGQWVWLRVMTKMQNNFNQMTAIANSYHAVVQNLLQERMEMMTPHHYADDDDRPPTMH